jgi:hypothetical protein
VESCGGNEAVGGAGRAPMTPILDVRHLSQADSGQGEAHRARRMRRAIRPARVPAREMRPARASAALLPMFAPPLPPLASVRSCVESCSAIPVKSSYVSGMSRNSERVAMRSNQK